jgi:hypothetical protein
VLSQFGPVLLNVHGNCGVKLGTSHIEILLQIIQSRLSNGVSIDVVEEVHDTKTWLPIVSKNKAKHWRARQESPTYHDPEIKLLDKTDLLWVCLLGSTRPIPLLHLRGFLIVKHAIHMREFRRVFCLVSSGGHIDVMHVNGWMVVVD